MSGLKMLPQVSLKFVYENQGHLMGPTAILQWYVAAILFVLLLLFAKYFLQNYLLVVLVHRNLLLYKKSILCQTANTFPQQKTQIQLRTLPFLVIIPFFSLSLPIAVSSFFILAR